MEKKKQYDRLMVHTPDGKVVEIELDNYVLVGTSKEGKMNTINCIKGSVVDLIEIYCYLRKNAKRFEEISPFFEACWEDLKDDPSLNEQDEVFHLFEIINPLGRKL